MLSRSSVSLRRRLLPLNRAGPAKTLRSSSTVADDKCRVDGVAAGDNLNGDRGTGGARREVVPTRVLEAAEAAAALPTAAPPEGAKADLRGALQAAFALHADRPFLGFPSLQNPGAGMDLGHGEGRHLEGGAVRGASSWKWHWVSYADTWRLSQAFGRGLARVLYRGGGSRVVALAAPSRVDWYIADLGMALEGIVSAAVHLPTGTEAHMHEAGVAAAASALALTRPGAIVCAVETIPFVRAIISASGLPEADIPIVVMDLVLDLAQEQQVQAIAGLADYGGSVLRLSEVLRQGAVSRGATDHPTLPADFGDRDSSGVFSVLLTSGSTGPPKGVPVQRSVWASELVHYPSPLLVGLSYQPLSYITDRHHTYSVLWNGGRLGVTRLKGGSNPQPTLVEALGSVEPTILFGVPRTYEVLQRTIEDEVESDPDSSVMSVAASLLGSRLEKAIVGGQSLKAKTRSFLEDKLALRVTNGYGSTDTGQIALNGLLRDNVEVQLLPDQNAGLIPISREVGCGELAVRTPGMIKEYFRNPTATAKAYTRDGYFRVGDLVEITTDREIRVLGRAGAGIKLDRGEFVDPLQLEAQLLEACSRFVDQVFLCPPSSTVCPFLLAIVKPTCAEIGSHVDVPALLGQLQTAAKSLGWLSHEVPQGVIVTSDGFTVENGLLNPTGKLVRPAIMQQFAGELLARHDEIIDQPVADQWIEAILAASPLDGLSSRNHTNIFTDLSFQEMGGDSLDAARVVATLARNEIVGIAPSDLLQSDSTMLSVLEKLYREGASEAKPVATDETGSKTSNNTPKQFVADTSWLKPDLGTVRNALLLTGATGFVGSELLKQMLLETDTSQDIVWCLVRIPRGRRLDTVHRSLTAALPTHLASRVGVLPGDITKPRLGLSEIEIGMLLRRLRGIVHAAADVNFAKSSAELFAANTQACVEVLQLAYCTGAKLAFVSTTDTFSLFPRMQPLPERWHSRTLPPRRGSGYATTKLWAEQIVQSAVSQGVPAVAVRMGYIGPHSVTGAHPMNDLVGRFVRGVARLGVVPSGSFEDHRTEFVSCLPVDIAALAATRILLSGLSGSQVQSDRDHVFHVANAGDSPSMSSVLSALNKMGCALDTVPTYGDWLDALLQQPRNPLLASWDFSRGDPAASVLPPLGGGKRALCDATENATAMSLHADLDAHYWGNVAAFAKSDGRF